MEDNIKNILESLLFVADNPLTIDQIKKVLADVNTKDIRMHLGELSEEYESRKGGFYLKEIAGGYQLRTRPEYKEWVKRFVQPNPLRLSRAAMETLAIIAYRQPIIRSDVEHIRGVDSGGIIRTLLELKLIRILGRKDIPGRPIIYTTTKQFLELFDLKDLKDLPSPKEIADLEVNAAKATPNPNNIQVDETPLLTEAEDLTISKNVQNQDTNTQEVS